MTAVTRKDVTDSSCFRIFNVLSDMDKELALYPINLFLDFLISDVSLTSRSVQGRGAQRSVHRDLRGPGAPRWRQEPLQGQRSDHRLHRVKAEL